MFGINGAELIVLVVVALLVVGPERLPTYAEQLAGWVRQLRRFVGTAKDRVATELGEDMGDVDWASLDPRRYDPRRIVREALLEEIAPPTDVAGVAAGAGRRYTTARRATGAAAGGGAAGGAAAGGAVVVRDEAVPGAPAPFDDEAT